MAAPPPPPGRPPPPDSPGLDRPFDLLRKTTSKALEPLQSGAGIVNDALLEPTNDWVVKPTANILRRGSEALVSAITSPFNGAADGDIDVLGLSAPSQFRDVQQPAPPTGLVPQDSAFDAEDLFKVDLDDVEDDEDTDELIAGVELTSKVFTEGGSDLDWAAELLLLTHEPLRRDMLEMQRALSTQHFGELPEGWRVRSFFRFFTTWCSLISQQHAVEVSVHYDWLVAPTGQLQGELRSDLLSYHRTIELELLAISRYEMKIADELANMSAASEPWSEEAQELRERVHKLCGRIRKHLATEETILPDILRKHWGRVSPPQLVTRSLAAAKRAQAAGAKGAESSKLLVWIEHYLHRRSPHRAKHLVDALPWTKRWALSLGGKGAPHTKALRHLRCIIDDVAPKDDPLPKAATPRQSGVAGDEDDDGRGSVASRGDTDHEKQRRAGMVNAVLASANARRVDVPMASGALNRKLAEREEPLHRFKMDGEWVNRTDHVPDNLYKKIGLVEPKEQPRRI